MKREEMERFQVAGGTLLVHPKGTCLGKHCVIHNPSDHHMKDWPLNWRGDTGVMERLCSHGVGHPDPDHLAFVRLKSGDARARIESVHGCDGCCAPHRSE